jgi:hypothetical protein
MPAMAQSLPTSSTCFPPNLFDASHLEPECAVADFRAVATGVSRTST